MRSKNVQKYQINAKNYLTNALKGVTIDTLEAEGDFSPLAKVKRYIITKTALFSIIM